MAEVPPRPNPFLVNFDEIPRELQFLNQWVLWRYIWKEDKDKWDKPPYQPNGKLASSTARFTWRSFEAVKEAYVRGLKLPADAPLHFDGVGFVPLKIEKADSHIVLGDLDKCRDEETGEISPEALRDLKSINSYCEPSPSGSGVRFIAKGCPPFPPGKDGRKKGGIELYQGGHYLTITGHRLTEFPGMIERRPDELNAFYEKHFSEPEPELKEEASQKDTSSKLTDDRIIALAAEAHNGDKFLRLMAGEWKGLTNQKGEPLSSQSEADGALVGILAFYSRDIEQILRIIQCSKLWDEKWQRHDYQERTIGGALELVTETYSGDFGQEKEGKEDAQEISEEELSAYSLPKGAIFECHLPDDHFLQRYIAYGSEISDAYPDYWLASGLFSLAVVADRKLKIILKQGTIYPNLYISINGKSSLSRKSTVVNKTEEMLCQVLWQLFSALVPTEFSPEAFTEHLSDHNHAPWLRDEAAGVLSLMRRDYMRGFKDSLMQLFDCKPFYRKLRTSQRKNAKTEFRVDDPYLNVLFATTDASLAANTDQNDTLSGFLARFLFFFPQGQKPKWLPLEEGTAQNSIFEGVIRDQLSSIAQKMEDLKECTSMHFSQEAASYFTEWQRVREHEWTASNDGFCMQIYSRLVPAVAKIGILFELGAPEFDATKPIRLEFIQEACRLADEYFMPTARAVYDLVGTNAEKNVIDRITMCLKNKNGKATRREILRDIKIKSADFNDYLATMIESGMVEVKTVKRSGKGRDSLYILLLPQAKVSNVSYVSYVSNVTNVTENPSEKADESLDTLGTSGTVVTKETLGEKDSHFSNDYLNGVLACRRLKKALSEGITDPLKLAEAVGIPVCTLARHAANYPGIDLRKAGEILVTMGRVCWWPLRGIKEERKRAEQERQAREEHFRQKAERSGGLA